MKNIKKFLAFGALAGLLSFSSCEKPYDVPEFKSVYGRKIASNLERPSGLAFNYGSKKSGSKGIQEDNSSVFVENPLFYHNEIFKVIPEKTINPIISDLSGEINNLKINSSEEIDVRSLFSDFNGCYYSPVNDSIIRPNGLTLDNLVLKDGTHLLSSNSSDKIFKVISPNLEIYSQDSRLDGITDMILGTDGKTYVVAASKMNYYDSLLVELPKRVISIDDNKNINVEFELPSDVHTHPWWMGEPSYPERWWTNSIWNERLKIAENSETGKQKFGSKFYVADLLEGKIYQSDNNNNVGVLAEGLRFPNSIAVDESGNIYYTASHFSLNNTEYPTELFILNPETGESRSLYKFNEDNIDLAEYQNSDLRIWAKYNGGLGMIPYGFNITNILSESETSLNFVFTNSHDGSLTSVNVKK